ncbi:MAG TPA: termination factor Rho [Candidatus Paenibacillus intestinavium]|nr:termination factor Rho [Candidatus Paenibacillus intestinavium]
MNMYGVVRKFKDKDNHVYNVGDIYPAEGVKKPTKERIKTLSTTSNKYGQIYITESGE